MNEVTMKMTFYQELQLNQAGSKNLLKNCTTTKDKVKHFSIYLFKVLLTLAFCVAFVTLYSNIFGADNSIVGVVVLLCVMVFRNADLGIKCSHALGCMAAVFAILAFGPRLSNMCGAFGALVINLVCIFALMILGCHNVIMFNHSTLVLGYLLLQGYDVTGELYIQRLFAIFLGAAATMIIYYRNHHKKTYKRNLKDLLAEFDLHSARSRWQLTLTFGVSSLLFIAGLLDIPRAMWIAIAAMSVLVPFEEDLKKRVIGRIPGNIGGGLLFLLLYSILPPSMLPYMGIIGGIGVGFSASYGWQAVFNSLGAISIAVGLFGLPGAILLRILNNAAGAIYGLLVQKLSTVIQRKVCIQ